MPGVARPGRDILTQPAHLRTCPNHRAASIPPNTSSLRSLADQRPVCWWYRLSSASLCGELPAPAELAVEIHGARVDGIKRLDIVGDKSE